MKRNIQKLNKIFSVPSYLSMPCFGLDIADDSIKFIQLISTNKGLEVGAFGEKKIPNGVIEIGRIKDSIKLEEIILEIKKENNIKDARISILENQVYSFQLILEKANVNNIRESIELLLEDHIPIPAPETIFDFEILKEDENSLLLQVGAIHMEVVEEYTSVFSNCGIKLHSFEVEAQALGNSLIKKDDPDTYMIVDFGKKRTGLFIVSKHVPVFTSTIDFGGDLLNSMLQKSLNTSIEEAEKIKIEYGLQRNLENKEIFPVLLNSVSVLKDEIQKHFVYWHTHENEIGEKNPPIKKILLSGGNSSIIGLSDYLTATLKVETTIGDVWTNICDLKERVPHLPVRSARSFATAIGLGLRDFEND